MKPQLLSALFTAFALTHATAALAGAIDMNDPRRTVGREDDVRIDALLLQDTVSPGSAIGVAYQIENLTSAPIAIAEKVVEASYDADAATITFAIGSEIPKDGKMPRIAIIRAGEKKVFRAGATPLLGGAARAALAPPRFVQVKVSILRDPASFETLRPEQMLSDEQFDRWLDANDSIFLNSVPVHFTARRTTHSAMSADQSGSFGF